WRGYLHITDGAILPEALFPTEVLVESTHPVYTNPLKAEDPDTNVGIDHATLVEFEAGLAAMQNSELIDYLYRIVLNQYVAEPVQKQFGEELGNSLITALNPLSLKAEIATLYNEVILKLADGLDLDAVINMILDKDFKEINKLNTAAGKDAIGQSLEGLTKLQLVKLIDDFIYQNNDEAAIQDWILNYLTEDEEIQNIERGPLFAAMKSTFSKDGHGTLLQSTIVQIKDVLISLTKFEKIPFTYAHDDAGNPLIIDITITELFKIFGEPLLIENPNDPVNPCEIDLISLLLSYDQDYQNWIGETLLTLGNIQLVGVIAPVYLRSFAASGEDGYVKDIMSELGSSLRGSDRYQKFIGELKTLVVDLIGTNYGTYLYQNEGDYFASLDPIINDKNVGTDGKTKFERILNDLHQRNVGTTSEHILSNVLDGAGDALFTTFNIPGVSKAKKLTECFAFPHRFDG
ncbi:MAG: hypothetical protein EZS28_044156, partial [Streblomastix strix]